MIRFGANPIILLINNKGYTIEIEIHDGPYNMIQNWDYVGLVKSLHNGHVRLGFQACLGGRFSEFIFKSGLLTAWLVIFGV